MCDQGQICTILLIGIPGSGKSFFRVFLENYITNNNRSILGSVQVCSVCYDDYCNVRNPNQLCDGNTWKCERLQVLNIVKNIVVLLKENKFKRLKELFPNIVLINENVENPDCILVVIDDNMYYKSMRYEYFQLAKLYNLSFCQIFFDISLDEALKCNVKRCLASHIPTSIIETMFSKIEPPQPSSNLWENYSISISSYANFQDENILSDIFKCIKDALANPVKSVEIDSSTEEARQITNSNALHQIDNTLKQLVGLCIKQKLKGHTKEPHLISQYYSDKRLKLLQRIKERSIVLPVDLNTQIDNETICMIRPILFDLLQK